MSSLQGHFLIAATDLVDPNFRKTIVLMVQHDEDGALGLVVNRPTSTPLKQAWEQVRESACQRSQVLYLGGPCQGPLMALHGQAHLADIEVLPGLYFCGEPAKLERLVEEPQLEARFFCGYSGWSPGQLESELEVGGWLTCPATPREVLHFDEDLWLRIIRRVTRPDFFATLGLRAGPADPAMN